MRYFDGDVKLGSTDLTSDGFGTPWGQTRSWSNISGYAAIGIAGIPLGYNGNGWVDSQLPFLTGDNRVNNNWNTVIVILSGTNALFFDNVGSNLTSQNSNFKPRFFGQDKLLRTNGEFLLTDTAGDQFHFYDLAGGQPGITRWGRFKSMTDANGNTTVVTSWTADGKPAEIIRGTPH